MKHSPMLPCTRPVPARRSRQRRPRRSRSSELFFVVVTTSIQSSGSTRKLTARATHQAFLAVSDRVIIDHLQGRHVIGVYPLLADETCWFLAADFDKGDWMADTAAFRETCNSVRYARRISSARRGLYIQAGRAGAAPACPSGSLSRRVCAECQTSQPHRRHGVAHLTAG